MSSFSSYPSVFSIGHKAVAGLLQHDVYVEEKIDGSQFSFGNFEQEDGTYRLRVRSKGAEMEPEAPQEMFNLGVEYVKSIQHQLTPGWTYRGEYLKKPKHNALVYERVPRNHIMIFDINTGEEAYLGHEEKFAEAERIGLECVPLFHMGRIEDPTMLRSFFEHTSCLGGQKIEGVVIKPVEPIYGRDKKALLMKFVSEAFKEVHSKAWGEANPKQGDILTLLGANLCTQARWQKALIHLQEQGKIEGAPKDIGLLVKEVPLDILKECEQDIKDALFKWAWPHLKRASTRGLPQWYKEELVKLQFERGIEEYHVLAQNLALRDMDEVIGEGDGPFIPAHPDEF